MSLRRNGRLLSLGVAVFLAIGLLAAGRQITARGWYSASPAYRAQVDSLLAGRFSLTDAPEALAHDYAWTESGVQQVWGLGVPLWQLPFEAVARIIGASPFPDRVALLFWLALVFYVVIRGFKRDDEPWWIRAGSVLVSALLPAFVTLVLGRVGVYEEAAIYAYGAAMLLMGGMLRLVSTPTRWRYLVLVAGAGLVGFIRPTAWCFGLSTALVATAIWLSHRGRRGLVEVAIAGLVFVAGGAALYATNVERFGNGFEFGHRLNLQGLAGNVYATRFGYPMQHASLGEATKELAGSLFDRPELRARGGFYQKHLHHGVSSRPRWREYYFTTFTWWYLPALLAGLFLGIRAWRRRDGPGDPCTRWLVAWAIIGVAPLIAYYLRAPFLSSRYELDMAPAFAALLVVAWRGGARALVERRRGIVGIVVLAIAWLACVVTAERAEPRSANPVGRAAAIRAARAITGATKVPRQFPGTYDLDDTFLPIYTDVLDAFDRCVDPTGVPIAADSPALPGDTCVHGERPRGSSQWHVTQTIVPETGAATASAGELVASYAPPPALYLNLDHWDLTTGQVGPAIFAFVDDPQFIELDVATADGAPADWAREVRVAVGLTHLRLVSTTPTERGMRLRFEAPHLGRGLEVAFFAFGPDVELDRPRSRFLLFRIRWRA